MQDMIETLKMCCDELHGRVKTEKLQEMTDQELSLLALGFTTMALAEIAIIGYEIHQFQRKDDPHA